MARNKNNELLIGLTAPLGVDLEAVTVAIERVLSTCAYTAERISLSEFLREDTTLIEGGAAKEFDDYIKQHQAAGNSLRQQLKRNDAVALGALLRTNRKRKESTAQRRAFILRQFKTVEEVELMRKVYRDRFILVGVFAPKQMRKDWLAKKIAETRGGAWTLYSATADELIKIDDAESVEHGQQARDTFPLADIFTTWRGAEEEERVARAKTFEGQIERFMHCLLGRPTCVPTTEEFLMSQARAVSLRSADWARQIGAIIASRDGSVIAVGRNDDPKVGGGVVSTREYRDSALEFKKETVQEFLERIEDWIKPEELSKGGIPALTKEAATRRLKSTRIMGLGEFGRMVHAEMAAIADAAARGVPVRDQIMFCTTFPCQNCAKHLIAAGIKALVHIEPYPKSLLLDMYPSETVQLAMESLASEDFSRQLEENKSKFLLINFIGVAPRRYEQLFTMPVRKGESGAMAAWDPRVAEPRLFAPLENFEYSEWEYEEAKALKAFLRVPL